MPTYLRPGVHVEEYLQPLSDIAIDPGDSFAAFVGTSAGGGPVGPVTITSWNQYRSLYVGAFSQGDDDLSHAVYSFFNNGGTGCYVVRAVNADAVAAKLALMNAAQEVLVATATAPGVWANSGATNTGVNIILQHTGTGSNRFDLIVEVGSATVLSAREQFLDLSMNPADGRYALDYVNSPVVGSKYISLATGTGYTYNNATPVIPTAISKTPLTGGTDGTGTASVTTAVTRLDNIQPNLVVNVPGASLADLATIIQWAVDSGRHFIVADVPRPASGETAAASVTAMTAFSDTVVNSSYVAVYGPWVYTVDPTARAGQARLTAPGGAVVGQYMTTDRTRGVHKAPAGIGTALAGVVAPYQHYTNAQQDSLAQSGVNLIKVLPGAGTAIMGARTQALGFPDRYVPIRRLLIDLKTQLTAITRFAVFENNDDDLWATIEDTVTNYLQGRYDLGAFKGEGPEDAFYVICDETNNPPSNVEAGVITIEIGVALQHPAEFIVIRLGQTSGRATATDNLEENE